MRKITTLARAAYRNRYAFDRVTIHADGSITGHWSGLTVSSKLGHIDDCHAVRTPTGTRFYNRDFLVYTFEPGA